MSSLLQTQALTKRFGFLAAVDRVDVDVAFGEVHALVGENGAGKSTLLRMLYGEVPRDSGVIEWKGVPVQLSSPKAALDLGIGMVHQHFTLVPAFRVWENLWLSHPDRTGLRLDRARARAAVEEISGAFDLDLRADARVADLSVGARQRVEIAKALTRDCELLILDEPTAVLAPSEVVALFDVIRRLRSRGTSTLLVTHKLDEILEIADRITVLRRGCVTGRTEPGRESRETLTRWIVGGEPPDTSEPSGTPEGLPERRPVERVVRLQVTELSTPSAGHDVELHGITFEVGAGELLGIAGVDGNGQDELVLALAGLLPARRGCVRLDDVDVSRCSVRERWERGLAVVPGDRRRQGLVLTAPLWENLALRSFGEKWARGRFGVDQAKHRDRAAQLVAQFDVRTESLDVGAGTLSGGNQQKLLLAREFANPPRVAVLSNPTRGLDVSAIEALFARLDEMRREGVAILLFSTELDEVLEFSDRIAVMRRGRLMLIDDPTRASVGAHMVGPSESFDV